MVSLINLGNFTNIGGKTVSSGSASGLDVTSLVNDLVKLRQKPADDLATERTKNSSVITALSTLRSKFDIFKTASNALRNPFGVLNQSQNIFNARQSFITSNTSIAGSTYLGVTANSGADITSYNITVDNIATNKISRTSAGIFTSATDSVTDAAATNNANRFSAGTFQISGGQVKNDVNTPSGDLLVTADYSVTGTVSGTLLDSTFGTGGIDNLTASGASGDASLINDLSKGIVTATQPGGVGTTVTLKLTMNGKEYFSNLINANGGGGTNEVNASTTITFTNSDTATSFQVRTASAFVINNSADLSSFAAAVDSGLNGPKIYQTRTITAFDSSKTTGTAFSGLGVNNVQLKSNKFDPSTGANGQISNFSVTRAGVDNSTISVKINGETFQATGLLDTQTANITLTSTTDSNKTFRLNINDAGVTLNLSSSNQASIIQKDLNTIFGTGVNITLAQGDSLNTIAGRINSSSATSKVSASVVKVADNDFRLEIKSNLTGTENAFTLNDVAADVFTSTVTLNASQAAEDAQITANGLSFTRSTNEITDVISKVTFNLFQETPALTTLKVDVDKNVNAVKDAVKTFVNTYNDLLQFAADQQERDPQTAEFIEDAFLGSSLVLNNTLTSLQTRLFSTIGGLASSDPKSLADLGITLVDIPADPTNKLAEVKNAMQLDEAKLQSLLSSSFDKVKSVFGANFNSSQNDKVQVFKTSNATKINSVAVDKKFTIDIDITRAVGEQAKLKYNDGTTTVSINADFTANSSGGLISGKTGTVFEGLQILYVGGGIETITDNTLTQGVADQLFNVLDPVLAVDGSLDVEVISINDKQKRIDTDTTDILDEIETFRQELLARFSAMEQAISSANNILRLLDANSAARNNS